MSYTHTYITLVQTSEEVKQYLSVNVNLDIRSFLPDLEWAEERYLEPIIGSALLQYLRAQLESSNMSADAAKLLPFCQKVEVYLGMWKYLPILQVNVSDGGVRINTDSSNKTAFQWQIEDLKQGYLAEKGFEFIEALYKFLEKNKGVYEAHGWTGNLTTNNRKFFIRSAIDYDRFVRINQSRRVYVNILPIMKRVEEFIIEGQLGSEFYQELKAAILDDSLGGESSTAGPEVTLVEDYISPAVAYITMSQALLDLNMVITADGIMMSSIIATGSSDSVKATKAPADNLLSLKMEEYSLNGMTYLKRMKDYLDKNASEDVFTTYFNSSLYSDPTGGDPLMTERSPDDIIFNGL